MTKEEYLDWLNHPVTAKFRTEVTDSMEKAASELFNRFEPDPVRDTYLKGFVGGVRELLEYEPEFTDEG